jgi:hypothetical protein
MNLSSKKPSTRRENVREFKVDYFSHVFADYCRLPEGERRALLEDLPASLKKLFEDIEKNGRVPETQEDSLDWGEVATIEDKVLARQDEATLRRRAWQLRSRYARLVGPERYQLYLASRPPDETDPQVSAADIRADLRRVLGATHLNYSLAIVRENNRRSVMRAVGRWALGLCGVALVVGVAADVASYYSGSGFLYGRTRLAGTLVAVVLFGCLGAYLSIQRRLQQTSDGGDPVIAILGLIEFHSIKQFPLIAGGLFAIVLYFVLAAGFMQGTLFPELVRGVPNGMTQWAKLFIWAFLAGFAERLVPDTLDRLVNQAQPRDVPSAVIGQGGRSSGDDESKKRAEQEAKKKADDEAKKRAEEEATKRAEEEAEQADEEAKRRADEEAKKKDEEALKRAEEKAAKAAEEAAKKGQE